MSLNLQKGFGLTEALIGLVILSAGLITIYGVHSDFLRSANDSRDRDKAIQIASSKLEEIRDDLADGILDKTFPDTGTEEDYSWEITSTPIDTDARYNIKVAVSWSGLFGGETVVVGAQLKTMSPSNVISVTTNGEETLIPSVTSMIGSPVGEAEYGDGNERVTGTFQNNDDGTGVIENDGKFYLVDTSDNTVDGYLVLLKSSNSIVSISGKLFVHLDGTYLSAESQIPSLYVGAPDISVCKTVHNSLKQIDSSKYYSIPYNCYMGKNWYGDIGITAIEVCTVSGSSLDDCPNSAGSKFTATLSDSLACVGDPSDDKNDAATNDFSVTPQSRLKRSYRGYAQAVPTVSVSAASNYDDDATYYVINGIQNSYVGHQLFYSGTSNCLSTSSVSGAMETLEAASSAATTGWAFSVAGVSSGSATDSSPGKYFCLSDDCPSNIEHTYLGGKFFNVYIWDEDSLSVSESLITSVTAGGNECLVGDVDGNRYKCTVNEFGGVEDDEWSSGYWRGDISVVFSEGQNDCTGTIERSFVVQPSVTDVRFSCTQSAATSCSINSLYWTSSHSQNHAGSDSVINWETTESCVDVRLQRCIVDGADGGDTCSPLTSSEFTVASGATRTLGPTEVDSSGTDQTYCYAVFADNEISNNECIQYKNQGSGQYNYN